MQRQQPFWSADCWAAELCWQEASSSATRKGDTHREEDRGCCTGLGEALGVNSQVRRLGFRPLMGILYKHHPKEHVPQDYVACGFAVLLSSAVLYPLVSG